MFCAREMHSTTEIRNDVSEQVCVKHLNRCKTSNTQFFAGECGMIVGPHSTKPPQSWDTGSDQPSVPAISISVLSNSAMGRGQPKNHLAVRQTTIWLCLNELHQNNLILFARTLKDFLRIVSHAWSTNFSCQV